VEDPRHRQPDRVLLSELHEHPSGDGGPKWRAHRAYPQRDGSPPRHRPDLGALRMIDLLELLKRSPSPYHAAESAAAALTEVGCRRQSLGEPIGGAPGGAFVVRGGAIVAWHVPAEPAPGFVVIGAHTDSP